MSEQVATATPALPAPPPAEPPLPACPITGEPASRRVQTIAPAFIVGLWKGMMGVDVSHLYGGVERVGLYESPCGLMFFDPIIAGDERFYADFYGRVRMHKQINARAMARVEFRRAAGLIPAGARVLDVGCGTGAFGRHVPHAHYVGLDPFAPRDAASSVVRETLDEHLAHAAGSYDVVCAFQVIEHMADPLGFARRLVEALRPGGLLIIGAPLHPSPLTAIPNFLVNTPPHHLSWWNRGAFAALARTLDLDIVEVADLPPSPHSAIIQWINVFSLHGPRFKGRERYFVHRWTWHLGLALSYGLARIADRLLPMPKSAKPIEGLLAARKI